MRPLATPTSGISPTALLRLLDTLEQHRLDPHALVIEQHGRPVLACAWRPYRLDTPALVYSASKTYVSLAVGHLRAEGLLSLTDDVGALLSRPNPYGFTVRDLLTMTTGHSREQTLAMPLDVGALLGTAPVHTPGRHFAYSSPASLALSHVVTALTGLSLTDYLRLRVLEPLDMSSRWMKRTGGVDGSGGAGAVDQGYSGFHLTARDLARTARMILDGGRFGGRGVEPADYTSEMVRPWADTAEDTGVTDTRGEPDTRLGDWSLGYGYQVWRSRHGFRLDGAYGQLGIAVPERDLVIGYQGATTDVQATLDAIWTFVESVEVVAGASVPGSDTGGAGEAGSAGEVPDDDASLARALARRVAEADSWNGAAARPAQPTPADVTEWTLTDDGAGWLLEIPETPERPGGRVAVPRDGWASTTLGAGERCLALAARGQPMSDGGVLAHLVVRTAPHRLALVRDPAGVLRAEWHTVPLWNPDLAALLVPERVAR